jgi:hypothetical protein
MPAASAGPQLKPMPPAAGEKIHVHGGRHLALPPGRACAIGAADRRRRAQDLHPVQAAARRGRAGRGRTWCGRASLGRRRPKGAARTWPAERDAPSFLHPVPVVFVAEETERVFGYVVFDLGPVGDKAKHGAPDGGPGFRLSVLVERSSRASRLASSPPSDVRPNNALRNRGFDVYSRSYGGPLVGVDDKSATTVAVH